MLSLSSLSSFSPLSHNSIVITNDWRSPNALFRVVWDAVSLLLLLFLIFSVPYCVTFLSHSSYSSLTHILIIGHLVDVFFIADFVLRLLFFVELRDGSPVMRRHERMLMYLKGRLIPDILASFPFDLIGYASGAGVWLVFTIRLLKLVRFFRLEYYFASFEAFLQRNSVNIHAMISRIIRTYIYLAITAHCAACLKYALAEHEGEDAWTHIPKFEESTDQSNHYWYLVSLYVVLQVRL